MNPLMRFFFGINLLVLMFGTGCGYSASGSTLADRFKTIYVEKFTNNIDFNAASSQSVYRPLMEVEVSNAVVDRFLRDGNLKIGRPDVSDLVLRGQLVQYERVALRYTEDEDVQEYRIYVRVNMELTDTTNGEIMWSEKNFAGQETYFLEGSQAIPEDTAIQLAIRDLARRIVERTIEHW